MEQATSPKYARYKYLVDLFVIDKKILFMNWTAFNYVLSIMSHIFSVVVLSKKTSLALFNDVLLQANRDGDLEGGGLNAFGTRP